MAPPIAAEAASVADLLAGASDRVTVSDGAGTSGARLERMQIDGVPHVVTYVDLDSDRAMRAAGCLVPAALLLWDVPDLLVPVTNEPIDLPT